MVSLYLLEMDHVKAIHLLALHCDFPKQTNLDPQMRVIEIFRLKPMCVIHMITPIDLAVNSCSMHGRIRLKYGCEFRSSPLKTTMYLNKSLTALLLR